MADADSICDLFDSLAINDDDDNADRNVLVPKCQEMCPREEMLFREKNGLLHRLELIDPSADNWQRYRASVASVAKSSGRIRGGRGNDHLQRHQPQQGRNHGQLPASSSFTNSKRAVKYFRRSSAGQELTVAEHLRPSAVLRATVDYLLDELPARHLMGLITNGSSSTSLANTFPTFYDFVFDRLRAVRQDMVVQRLVDANCLYILERCVHFYAYSHYTWHQQQCSPKEENKSPEHLSSSSSFDAHLNSVHLGECLQLLLAYYDHFQGWLWSTRRPVFEAAFLVFNFTTTATNCHGPSSEALKRYQRLQRSPFADDLFAHPLMKTAKAVLLASLVGNHIRALRLVSEVYNSSSSQKRSHQLFPIIFVVSGSLSTVHLQLLRAIAVGYRSPATTQLPLQSLATDWFCPFPARPSSVARYLELLAKSYGLAVKTNEPADCFNFTEDRAAPTRSLMIQKELPLPVSQWRLPRQPQLLHPLGWLPNDRLPTVYQRFQQI